MTKKYTREELQQYAKENFCLDKLAKEWEQMFFDLIKEKEENPIVPYQPTSSYRDDEE